METKPMMLDALGAAPGGLDEFRISAPREIAAVLKQLCDGNVQLHLNAADGSVVDGTVWAIDTARNSLAFSVDPNDPAMDALLACEDVVVVGYIDSVKLQFDAHQLVLVRGERTSVLSCAPPRELFRFQRRNAYRVRPVLRNSPVARVRHSEIAEMQLALRVVDVSIGGCALFLPDDVPPMQPGVVLNQVQINLDANTRFHVNLKLQHVTSLNAEARGVRLGCEFVHADAAALRALQRFIDLSQKRSRLLSV
jgi:c-di-GMP-binding flagellar brake protein YcgR